MDLKRGLADAVEAALARHGYFSNEDGRKCAEDKIDLQSALVEALGRDSCERELPATFAQAKLQPPAPPASFGLAKDVCSKGGRHRRLDILWRNGDQTVAVEVKLRRITNWHGTFEDGETLYPRDPVDAYGYEVLKDIHRLERLTSVTSAAGEITPTARFVLYLTNDPYEYEARVNHINYKLTEGRELESGHLAQFNLTKSNGEPTSRNTLWRDYPPFKLAGDYSLKWTNVEDDVSRFMPRPPTKVSFLSSRLLSLRVDPQ